MEALAIVAVIYFIPTIVAVKRRHLQTGAIVALNLLLGWTVLGWIGALIWSLTNSVRYRDYDGPVRLDTF